MPDITPISASPSGALPASTPGAEASLRPAPGAALPPLVTPPGSEAQAPPVPAQKPTTPSELQKQIEATLAESRVQTNLRFRVDEELRRVVVSVVDSDTGETILQIPDDTALAVARRLADRGTGLLDQQA
ncbi:flagellar protein FlaG [Thermomonas sp.]|uniref:flagellar protein FlaG n=1 Tax=Thermomonas sp. TaxID=1971895 RepID=UPI002EE35AE7